MGSGAFGNVSLISDGGVTTNGSGIKMTSPAFLSFGNSGFAVNAGTGYCLRGTGTVFYDRWTFSDTVASLQNKKIQNTLTIFQYISTPSLVA